MSLFNLPIIKKDKPVPPPHPWAKTIRDELSHMVKQSHNSVRNVRYPKLKEKVFPKDRVTFTVMGNRTTKEFIYCVHLVQSMHTYRSKKYAPPVIRAFTGVEWESFASNDLKMKYGGLAHCLKSQVAVIRDNEFIGGEKELKELLESTYYIHMLALDYCKESVKLFAKFTKDIGRPCAYLHISVNGKPIGSLMFMIYSDIVPQTCENFLRLCQSRKGGYSGTPIHRIVKDGWIQCGGFGLKSVKMDCENFIVQHDRRGVLAMANAGRHSDCSTQFFILLQPNPCFKLRFVAFGQLIDGEETLKQIENLNTYYETPVDNIVIYSAGVVNLDCQDIRINKGAREYIDKHIEDLVIIGDLFYAILLDRVFLEAEFRKIQMLEALEPVTEEEEEAVDEAFRENINKLGEYIPENIRATRRFIRKKDADSSQKDNQSQVDKQEKKRGDRPGSGASRNENITINNDYDMESLPQSYEPEQYSYKKVSATSSIITKAPQPYYLALTDVRYPDEVDSTFDLKRFLQGNYCLEVDLMVNKPKAPESPKESQRKEEKLKAVSAIISSYHGVMWHTESSSDSDSYSEDELDSDDEQEIKKFLDENGEKVSFSGQIIKNISTKYVSKNPLEDKLPHELWNDEELRRMRLAVQDIKSRVHKKVSLAAEPWKHQSVIKRRMTGYVKPGDFPASVQGFEGDEKEEGEDESNDEFNRLPSAADVSICAPEQHVSMVKRRQTGFDRNVFPFIDIEEEEDEENNKPAEDTRTRSKIGVKIAPREMNTQQIISPVASRKFVDMKKMTVGPEHTRPSVLMRLYDDIAIDSQDVPTFKDYKPVGEMKNMSLLSVFGKENPLLRRGINLFESSTNVGTSRFDRKKSFTKKKHSVDSDKSVRYVERKSTNSYRALEYSRKRPSISVAQYQQMNKQKMEEAALAEQRKGTREKRWK